MNYEQASNGQGTAYAQLQELGESDFEIKDGEPDIKGWSVTGEDGTPIGEVAELLFDPRAMKVRYIVLDAVQSARRVLVPIGLAELHPEHDSIILTGITPAQIGQLSAYEGWAKLTAEVESADREVLEPGAQAGYHYPHFYDHAHFDEDRFYRSRENGIGNEDISEKYDELSDDMYTAERRERARRIVQRIRTKHASGSNAGS